jgi:NADH-quinone oxidoreductase subunit J
MIDYAVFGVVFVVALGASMAMLFARNAVHVALFLVATQVALALAFLLQGAFFIAAVQIIVYAGAIMVLFLFVIMLLGVDKREKLVEPFSAQRPLAFGLGVVLVAEIGYIALRGADLISATARGEEGLAALNTDPGNVESIARLLFSRYLLPFEVTSVLLVVAIVGTMVLARRMDARSLGAPGPAAAVKAAEAEAAEAEKVSS